MLGAKPEADQAGRNATQQCPLVEEPQSQRRREPLGALEYAPDHPVLDEELELLRGTGRELSTALDRAQILIAWGSLAKTRGQNVGGRYRVLNCQIYAHPANRRHGVSRIPDAHRPGRCQTRKRSTVTVNNLMSDQSVSSPTRSRR